MENPYFTIQALILRGIGYLFQAPSSSIMP